MSDFRVLIPLDGSRLAEHALAFLPALSQFGQLEVTLLSVVDFADDLLVSVPSEGQEREENLLSTYQREIAADVTRHLGAEVHTELQRGAAATRILETAEAMSPDLLIISTHGRSGIARWQRGAVSDKVIAGARCPVLAIGPKAMEQGQWLEAGAVAPFNRILVPLDGSERAEAGLEPAVRFAQRYSSQIHLYQVLPYVPIASGFWSAPSDVVEEVFDSGREYLNSVAARLDDSLDVVTDVSMGAPAIEIEAYIKENGIDLVVMTSHGRSGLARAALGSVTDRVIGAGPPVLVIPNL